jgi:hypothetical protein
MAEMEAVARRGMGTGRGSRIAVATRQIAKAIDYLQEGTEMALNRLENEGKIAQSPDGFWEIVVGTGAPPHSLTVAA